MIELNRVTKLYQRVIGVNDMTLDLPPGAYGLLGPNGSGKSTLLNLIIGQLGPTQGIVRVLGENPRDNPRLYRQLGYCPSGEGLYANVSGLEWVTYLLQLQGQTRRLAGQLAEQALDLVGMRGSMLRPISSYSRGMRQRTKLAQAIAHDPSLLILDEPFNGLDPIARHDITQLLRGWIEQGKSLLLASHLLHEVEAVTRSFLLICGGRLLASGTAAEVHEILAGLPNEITLHCDRPRELGERILQSAEIDFLRVEEGKLIVSTQQPNLLFPLLPAWVEEEGFRISEITSAHDSLEALFNSLLKIHRGEL